MTPLTLQLRVYEIDGQRYPILQAVDLTGTVQIAVAIDNESRVMRIRLLKEEYNALPIVTLREVVE